MPSKPVYNDYDKILASLLHDDVIDHAESRRGKESVNKRFNPSRSTPAFIVSFNYIIKLSILI